MPNIDVITAGTIKKVAYQPGNNLLEILRNAGIHIRNGCQEIGACALCKIYVRAGDAGPITLAEELQLGHWLFEEMRLACQTVPQGDLIVELIPQASTIVRKIEFAAPTVEYLPDRHLQSHAAKSGYGVAIDVGTTNVSVSLFQWINSERLATSTFSNPQGDYGTDVIARVIKASEAQAIATELQSSLLLKIKEVLHGMVLAAGISLGEITGIGYCGEYGHAGVISWSLLSAIT